jgi:hypothetical protein
LSAAFRWDTQTGPTIITIAAVVFVVTQVSGRLFVKNR